MTGSDFHSVTRVGSMQPYFLPYLGYFSLIKHADIWVVFDTPKFIRHGWIERNRILSPRGQLAIHPRPIGLSTPMLLRSKTC